MVDDEAKEEEEEKDEEEKGTEEEVMAVAEGVDTTGFVTFGFRG